MNKNYRLVIFDLDGTLLNTLSDLAAAGNHALSAMGYPTHPEEAYKHFVGNGIPKLVERMLPKGHRPIEFENTMNVFSKYYAAHSEDKTVPYDGISELLDFLEQHSVILAVNSNKAHEFSQALIGRYFGDKISVVQGLKEGFRPKPAPDGVFAISEKTSVPLSEILYIGDSDVDVMTGKNAGVDVCSVLWGFRTREEVEPLSPCYIAQNVGDIEKIFIDCARQNTQ